MRDLHVFRPTAFDTLEDRVVMASGASMFSGVSLSDRLQVHQAVDAAFRQFRSDFSAGLDTINFQDSPTTVNPVVAPALVSFQSAANDRVAQLAVQLSDILSPLRGSSRKLVPRMLDQIVGAGPGSLATGVASTVSRLIAAINVTQTPISTTDSQLATTQQAAVRQARVDIQELSSVSGFNLDPGFSPSLTPPPPFGSSGLLGSQIEAANLAIRNEVNLFGVTPQGRTRGRRARLDLPTAQGMIRPAYATFESGLNTAIATYQNSLTTAIAALPVNMPPFDFSRQNATQTALTNARNALRATVIDLTNTLGAELSTRINGVLGTGAATNRAKAYIRSQVTGFDPGSLLDNLNDQIDTLTIISTSTGFPFPFGFGPSTESFSTSAFVFATNNLVAQSQLATASILSIATG